MIKWSWQRIRRVRVSRWGWLGAGLVFVGVLGWVPVNWPALATGLGATVVSSGVPGWVTVGGAGVLAAVAISQGIVRSRNRADESRQRQAPLRPMPGWAIWLGLAMVVAVGTLTGWGLVTAFGSGSAQDKAHLEAIKLAGSIAVGTGGAAALVLAARRQRATELGVQQQEQAQRLQERRAADARHDADERRVTELYTAAAPQLASESAPVRMAGMYALERLGQANPDHRQTIVNLFCAYLRMPYTPPEAETPTNAAINDDSHSGQPQQEGLPQPLLLDLAPTLAEAAGLSLDGAEQQRQERQVRRTAQRLLTQHLRPELDDWTTNPDFWGGDDDTGLDLDLAGATLDNWEFMGCWARRVNFMDTHFYGGSAFDEAQFHGSAEFLNARFHDLALFGHVQFHGSAAFYEAQFHGVTVFRGAQFHGFTSFADVWARLDHGHPLTSRWPEGYTVREADPGDGRAGRWGQFVAAEDESTEDQAADA